MNSLILNGKNMTTRAAAHDELASVLQLPAHYGRNLDALWDCITTMDAKLSLINSADMLDALGSYGAELLKTLQEADGSASGFRFTLES